MTLTIKEKLYQEYADAQIELKRLEARMDDLKDKIAEDMDKENLQNVATVFGSFYFITRKSWKYSDKVSTLAEKLKVEKKKEEESGKAVAEESRSLAFKKL